MQYMACKSTGEDFNKITRKVHIQDPKLRNHCCHYCRSSTYLDWLDDTRTKTICSSCKNIADFKGPLDIGNPIVSLVKMKRI